FFFFFFSSRRRHTRLQGDWSSDVCSSDLRFEIVWKTAPTTGEVEAEIATAASANEAPSDAPPNAGAEEVAAATGHEPAASSVLRSEERRVGKEGRSGGGRGG